MHAHQYFKKSLNLICKVAQLPNFHGNNLWKYLSSSLSPLFHTLQLLGNVVYQSLRKSQLASIMTLGLRNISESFSHAYSHLYSK